jgi:hypothetical protein
MAVQTLRNYDSKHTFKDTINFWSNRPWKNPSVGKTSEREEFFLFLQILEITSAKINQQQLLISSLRFPCLKCTGRKPTTATSKNVHTQPYRTDCTDCTDFWKFVPRICCSCTAAVRTVKNIFFSRFACCGVCNRYRNLCCIKSVPYGLINAAGCLDLRAQLCLENRASSLLPFPLQKIETLLLFLLSLNLSISHGKNEFVFGLFPPLESLSDS